MEDNQAAAAAITAAGNLAANAVTNSGNRRSQDRANEMNVNFWQQQNAYNHPSQQMARLQEAGLNPNLIYGTPSAAAVGNADKIAPSKATDYKMDNPIQNITSVADLAFKKAQTNLVGEQAKTQEQERALKGVQAANIGIQTARSQFDLGIATELRDTSLQAAKANVASLEAGTIGKTLDNEIKDKGKKDLIKDIYYRVQNAKANLEGTKKLNTLRQLEINLNQLGIQKGDNIFFRIFGQMKDKLPNLGTFFGNDEYGIPNDKK